MWQNLKTQILTKLKKSNCDKTQKTNCDKIQKLKLWQNLKNQIVTVLKNSNCDGSYSDSSESDIFDRPGVAGAVLQTASSLTHSLIHPFPKISS